MHQHVILVLNGLDANFFSLNVSKTFVMVSTNRVYQDNDDRNLVFDCKKIYFAAKGNFWILILIIILVT